MDTFLKIEALTTEYPKVLDIRLLSNEDLIRSLVQALVEI
jgi:hypothetical protein